MGLVQCCHSEWLNMTLRVTLPNIEVHQRTVVATTNNDIIVLVVESQGAQW